MVRPISYGRSSAYKKEKINLIKRDGTCCFLCGKELEDDITVEHLISLVSGGKNDISNMVLTHYVCNNELTTKPIYEKVKMAIERRSNL
jgi:5-methylcytosine-specific restriction endonuclease McrA